VEGEKDDENAKRTGKGERKQRPVRHTGSGVYRLSGFDCGCGSLYILREAI